MSITQASTSAPYGIYINYTGAAPDSGIDYNFLDFEDTGGTRFQVASDGDVKNHDNSYGALSDERIKQDITDANSQWDDVKALKARGGDQELLLLPKHYNKFIEFFMKNKLNPRG